MCGIRARPIFPILILAGARLLPAQESNPDLEGHYRQAQEAQQRGQYARAAQEWQAIVALEPGIAEAYSNLGMMYYLDRRFEAAIPPFQHALRIKPNLVSAHLFLGIAYYLVARPAEAIGQLRETLKLDSGNPLAHKWLGVTLLEMSNLSAAVAQLRLCRPEAAHDPEVLFHLGRAYSRISLDAFESIHDRYPDSPWDHFVRGEQLAVRGESPGALREFEQVAAADPAFPEIHLRTGRLWEAQGKWGLAVDEYIAELRNSPERIAAAQHLLGLLERSGLTSEGSALRQAVAARLGASPRSAESTAGALTEAERHSIALSIGAFVRDYAGGTAPRPAGWQQAVRAALDRGQPGEALRLLPREGGPEATFWKGRARLASGDADDALSTLLELRRERPADPQLLYYTGIAAERLALATLADFEKLAPRSYRVHQLRAECHAADQDYEGAIRDYRSALAMKPDAVQVHLALGRLYGARHEYDSAVTEFRAELEADPYSVPAMELLGATYTELHEPAQAKLYLLKALALNPKSAEAERALGIVAMQEARFPEAIRRFRRALELGSRDEKIYFQLGKALRQTGALEEAKKYEALFRQSLASRLATARRGLESHSQNDGVH